MLKESLLHWRLMVQAINPAGDSLFTQNNNSSLLEVYIISVVVLLVKERHMFKIWWQRTKVSGSFGLCQRGTLYSLTKPGFESLVQKYTSFPKVWLPNWYYSREQHPNHNGKGLWLNKEENSNRFTSMIRKQNQRQSIWNHKEFKNSMLWKFPPELWMLFIYSF